MGQTQPTLNLEEGLNFEHQDYFTFSQFNSRYIKQLNKQQQDQFYELFDFDSYLNFKERESTQVLDLIREHYNNWYYVFLLIPKVNKQLYKLMYFDTAFQKNIHEFIQCIKEDQYKSCMNTLNQQQLSLYQNIQQK